MKGTHLCRISIKKEINKYAPHALYLVKPKGHGLYSTFKSLTFIIFSLNLWFQKRDSRDKITLPIVVCCPFCYPMSI